MNERPIFLVGFMGSGKTTCAARLARSLGWEPVDTDRLVEQRERRPVARIFADSGEAFFRRAEWEVLRSLEGSSRRVVATGGGLFPDARARCWMKRRGVTVWLDVTLEEVRRRLGRGTTRPLWGAQDPTALRALFEKRRAAYALCDVRVAASPGDPEEVIRRIVRRIL